MPGKSLRLIAAAAVLVGIAGCSGKGNVDTSDSNGSFQSSNHQTRFFGSGDQQQIRAVSGTTLQGSQLNLASYRGKYVVVNYWSSNCGPCHGEQSGFEALSKQLAPKGVQFVGIDERDSVADGQNYERTYHVSYPSLFDSTDQFLLDFPGSVPSTTPFTLVIDPQGKIVAHATDSLDYTTLRTFVAKAQSEPT